MSTQRSQLERWFIQFGLSFIFLTIYPSVVLVGPLISLNSNESPFTAVYVSVFSSAFAWGVGYYCAWRITQSEDAMLAQVTPLTAKRFFINNAWRIRSFLFILYVFIPLVGTSLASLYFISGEVSVELNAWMMMLTIVLVHYAGLLVPLAMFICGPNLVTRLYFVLRHLFPDYRLLILVWIVSIPLNIIDEHIFPVFAPIGSLIEFTVTGLFDIGLLGQLVIFLLSPISGVALGTIEDTDPAVLPIIALLLTALLIQCVYRMRHVIAYNQTLVDQEYYDGWIEERSIYEAFECEQELAQSEQWDNATDDKWATLEKDETDFSDCAQIEAGPDYRSDLDGEEIILLQSFRIQGLDSPSENWKSRLLEWAKQNNWILIPVIIYIICRIVDNTETEVSNLANNFERILFCGWAVYCLFMRNVEVVYSMVMGPLPLRWPRLLSKVMCAQMPRLVLQDLCIVFLIQYNLDFSLVDFCLVLGFYLSLRLYAYLRLWLSTFYFLRRYVLCWIHGIFVIAFSAFLFIEAFASFIDTNEDLQHFLFVSPKYWFAFSLTLLVVGIVITLLSTLRGGTTVLGYLQYPSAIKYTKVL